LANASALSVPVSNKEEERRKVKKRSHRKGQWEYKQVKWL